jgi:alanine or glycine:cation symporter, AGCS family
MIASLELILKQFSDLSWGLPLLLLLIGGGLYLTLLSGFRPYRFFIPAIKQLFSPDSKQDVKDKNIISPFQALTTALASTIGMGNIAGVAVAISIGGPGAIFWMWVSGLIGMVTKFFTCSLAVMYRQKKEDGTMEGGPMYFIEEGLGKKWKPLAVFFSIAGLIGVVPVFNVNQLTQATRDILLEPFGWNYGFHSNLLIGIVLTVLTSVVVLGGLKRIGAATEKLVPGMVILYFICVMGIILIHIDSVPAILSLIFTEAFAPTHFKGDAFLGGTLGGLILLGIRRGAFSNEAGIGTAPMAHGASKEQNPLKEGMNAMLGPFIDTIIVCTLTAMAILVTGVWNTTAENGVSLTNNAFQTSIPYVGSYLLMACIAVFSISSLFSFSYYGTKCTAYLFGSKHAFKYNYFYLASILLGSVASLDMMINLIDGMYALMAIPTMVATIILAPKVVKKLKHG